MTRFLLEHGLDIEEHQQFDDRVSGRVFLRTAFTGRAAAALDGLRADFAPVAERVGMDGPLHDATPPRALIMVSKLGHCLNDLIFRWRAGGLGVEIAVVAGNHVTHRAMVEAAELPFVHVPVTAATKPAAEAAMQALVASTMPTSWCWPATCRCCRTPLHAALRTGHQHPPLVPAQLQGRQALSPGARAGRQDHRRHRALRDAGPRRRPDHRAGGGSGSTTPSTPTPSPPSGATPRRWRCPGPSGGTASTASCATAPAPHRRLPLIDRRSTEEQEHEPQPS